MIELDVLNRLISLVDITEFPHRVYGFSITADEFNEVMNYLEDKYKDIPDDFVLTQSSTLPFRWVRTKYKGFKITISQEFVAYGSIQSISIYKEW